MSSSDVPTINYNDAQLPYRNRDLSWLDFNYRVLQEAMDAEVPLLERLKFLAIYSNNLDEFFRVRVASNRNLIRVGKKTKKKLDFDPEEIQRKIIERVNEQQERFSQIFFEDIMPALREEGIAILEPKELNDFQIEHISKLFFDVVLPYIDPILLNGDKVIPFLNNASLYLAIELIDRSAEADVHFEYALVKIPTEELERFVMLPSNTYQNCYIMLDDLLRAQIHHLFPGYTITNSFSIKLSRDAELYIDDEYSGNLIQKIKSSLSKRKVGPASRLVFDRQMPKDMLAFYSNLLQLNTLDQYKEGRYHNNFDFFGFQNKGYDYLRYNKLEPLPYNTLEQAEDFFEEIKKKDHLIHVPYQSYESVIRFFEEAAQDPMVTHIKIVQYRVAKISRIMESLILAADNGKNISVFVEVKARFDEEANISWAEKLEEHGISVHYSFPGLKVHSKIALVRRTEGRSSRYYSYLGTGNFHEGTVKVYSDFGILTTNPKLTKEVVKVFAYLEDQIIPSTPFRNLLVGQFNLRSKLESCIKREINLAKKGEKAEILIKMNGLQDPRMIDLLYQASKAGVYVRIIVRGICCLIPGLPGKSENIEVVSIVDRFLEHARVFYFRNGGKELLYLGSADWMVRNLSYRIETVFPILDRDIFETIYNLMNLQWSDNVKARNLGLQDCNTYRRATSELNIRSQIETYYYFKRKQQ